MPRASVTRAQADLEAIDNPGSKREELLAILARQRAGGKVAESTEISSPGLDPYKKGKINSDVTTTTTSYAERQGDDREGARAAEGRPRRLHQDPVARQGGDGRQHHRPRRRGEEDQGLARRQGVAVEEKKSVEVERADGSKAGIETTKAKEISTKGASQTQTVKTTNFDGSSKTTTAKKGSSASDGKVIATKSSSVTTTSKSGTAISTDKSASGGFVAGKDGTGVQGRRRAAASR